MPGKGKVGAKAERRVWQQATSAQGRGHPAHLDEVGGRGEPERVGRHAGALPRLQQVVCVRDAAAIHDVALLPDQAAAQRG